MTPAAGDTPRLARALVGHALRALRTIPEDARGPALGALDRFLATPGPATFLRAVRVLGEERRRFVVESAGGSTLRRGLDDGLASLRQVPGLPAALVDRLAADLPLDARTGQRLHALADLARAYEEVLGRVAADRDEMRRRLRGAPRKPSARR
jgi:hypothetical protein